MSFLSRDELEDRDMSSSVSPTMDISPGDSGSADSPSLSGASGVLSDKEGRGEKEMKQNQRLERSHERWKETDEMGYLTYEG